MEIMDLYKIKKQDTSKASKVIARASLDYDMWKLILTDHEKRRVFLELIYEICLDYSLYYGEVYATSENLEGVCIWLPEKHANITFIKLLKSKALNVKSIYKVLKVCSIRDILRLNAIFSAMEKAHKNFMNTEQSMYLATIAVANEHQGKKFASKLIRPILAKYDKKCITCYLETADIKNIKIYENYYFELINELTNSVGDCNIYYMQRKPKITNINE